MDESRTKEVLDFLLTSFRAQMAIQNPTENCPFDFQQFLTTWRGKYDSWATLKATMQRDLEPLIEEGIFDSIVPYLTASMTQGTSEEFPNPETNGIISTELIALSPSTSKAGGRKISELIPLSKHGHGHGHDEKIEITIHVCDESKNLRQDFKCVQSVLVKEMGYFSKVAVRGQKLKDMDISVHCDVNVFDWLMKWVRHKVGEEGGARNPPPKLEATNVIGLMVSAEFLQMPELTEECVSFTANNIEEVILKSPNLGCLNESLTNRIASFYDNVEMEEKIVTADVTDRITSRLYTQYTLALNDPVFPESNVVLGEGGTWKGHYASTNTLFRCILCGRLVTNEVASKVPCVSMRLDCRGRIYSIHQKDQGWSLPNYIREVKRELKSWRKVYWRLWGTVHFLPCSSCHLFFPLKDLRSCKYHPKPPQLQVRVNTLTGEVQERQFEEEGDGVKVTEAEEYINPYRKYREEQQRAQQELEEANFETVTCAFGVYPCCKKAGYKFNPLPSTNGCQVREHTITSTPEMEPILHRLQKFRDLIVLSPKESKEIQKKDATCAAVNWGGITDLTPPKIPVNPSSRPTFSLTQSDFRTRTALQEKSSSAEDSNNSGTISDPEDNVIFGAENFGQASLTGRGSSQPYAGEFWSWNSDFTTRYNQDMQREREEKLMSDLEILLSHNRTSSLLTDAPSSMRLGYLSRRQMKNVGGSFIQLEERWREEQQKKRSSGLKPAKS